MSYDSIPKYNGDIRQFEDKQIRKGFIIKVYSLLLCQLLFTVGLVFNLVEGAKNFVMSDTGQALFWVSLILTFGLLIGLACNPSCGRKHQLNYIALTLYDCYSKSDFTDKGDYLVAVLIELIITGFLNIFIRNSVLQLICAGVGAILFSCYIVYDTQLIVGGSHYKYQFEIDDYVFAAITLYLDIINLFLYILQIIGDRRN